MERISKMDYLLFWSIIRSSIWEKDVDMEIPVGYDWTEVFRLFENHCILGIVASSIMSLPSSKRPSTELQEKLFSHVVSLVRYRYTVQSSIVSVFDELKVKGIHPVLLKGESISCLYPSSCQRAIGDIDIYVGEDDYVRACQIVNEYNDCQNNSFYEDVLHFHVVKDDVVYEIHRLPDHPKLYKDFETFNNWAKHQLSEQECSRININGCSIDVPNPQYAVSYIFTHFLRHFCYEGVGVRQLCDWAIVLNTFANQIDKDMLFCVLERDGLMESWNLFGSILIKDLGYNDATLLFKKSRDHFRKKFAIRDILSNGNFSNYDGSLTLGLPLGRLWQLLLNPYRISFFSKKESFLYAIAVSKLAFKRLGRFVLKKNPQHD